MENINNKTAILIKKLALEFDKIAIPVFAPYNLSPSQFKVIKYLFINHEKDVRQRDIELAFSMTNPTVTGILNNLEKNGWVRRIQNANDARSKLIKLTDKALNEKKIFIELGENLEKKFLAGLNDDEQKQLNDLLNKLLKNIKENPNVSD